MDHKILLTKHFLKNRNQGLGLVKKKEKLAGGQESLDFWYNIAGSYDISSGSVYITLEIEKKL